MDHRTTGDDQARRCLVVEDEADVADVLSRHLRRLGLATTVVSTMASARALLADERWQVVFVDVMLPDGDGRELLPVARAAADPPATVVVSVLTRYDLDAGPEGDAFLAKPFRAADVSRALAAADAV